MPQDLERTDNLHHVGSGRTATTAIGNDGRKPIVGDSQTLKQQRP